MTKEFAITLQRLGMILIVTVMVMDHYFLHIQKKFILGCAVISAILLATSITRLKLLEIKEKCETGLK